jgi:hypothetical protein
VRLLLHIKAVNTDAEDVTNTESNTVSCINNVLDLMLSSLSVSRNRKPVTLEVTNYHYKQYIEKLLHCGVDASGSNLLSSFWFLIQQLPTEHVQQIKPT